METCLKLFKLFVLCCRPSAGELASVVVQRGGTAPRRPVVVAANLHGPVDRGRYQTNTR